MKTKLDIAIERIILMVSEIHGYSDEERIARGVRWEIISALGAMSFEEIAGFVVDGLRNQVDGK